jgi:predicted nuclease with RNAse H fold
MLFTDSVFVGIDPTSSHKSFTYAALDKGMNLVALADGEMEDVTAFLGGQSSAVVAVNAPSGVNRGLVREKRKEMFKSLKTRASGFRVAELELRDRGITVSGTPSTISACPAWVQSGFALYRKLEKMGFKKYPTDDENSQYQLLETQPHAAFCVMTGNVPQSKASLEGKIQRQLLLYEAGVRIKDPMDFFEEITRHKMLKGNWPLELLYLPEQLDAMVAAYTAWLAVQKPENLSTVGDPSEGLIFLPERNLKENY